MSIPKRTPTTFDYFRATILLICSFMSGVVGIVFGITGDYSKGTFFLVLGCFLTLTLMRLESVYDL